MRIYIECTNTYLSGLNTGVPRVVRNVVNHAPDVGQKFGVECIPIRFRDGRFVRVQGIRYGESLADLGELRAKANALYWKITHALVPHISHPGIRNILLVNRHQFGLARFLVSVSMPVIRLFRFVIKSIHGKLELSGELNFQKGDWILLTDMARNLGYRPRLAVLRESGIRLACIVYDLIPITHPRFFSEKDRREFVDWAKWAANACDLFISISRDTQAHLQGFLATELSPEESARKRFDVFRLGMELDAVRRSGLIRDVLKQLFSTNRCFLTVGTIEPRKNHLVLLAAFERALQKGFQGVVVIVGRVGWLCESIIERIVTHAEYNKRLFHFQDITDTELAFCYERSRALIFPSKAEGFGLPIIEACARGLPVLASNIAVFREVGGGRLSYFDPDDPQGLAELLLDFERRTISAKGQVPPEFYWPNWRESTEELLGKILKNPVLPVRHGAIG